MPSYFSSCFLHWRHSCYVDYSRIYAEATCSVVIDTPCEWNMSHRFSQIFRWRFWSRRFRRCRRFFFIGYFYSSDFTELIRRFLAMSITHGFTRRRPVRSLQIPPVSGICPTDFTDFHRFFLLQFLSLPSLSSISHFSLLTLLSLFTFLPLKKAAAKK